MDKLKLLKFPVAFIILLVLGIPLFTLSLIAGVLYIIFHHAISFIEMIWEFINEFKP